MAILSPDVEVKVLFNLISEGNEIAFKMLFERYKRETHAFACKWTKSVMAADEISQEIFISLWTSRLQLSAVKNPEAYIYTIIYNNVKRYLKKEKNRKRILQSAIWKTNNFSNETDEKILANETQQIVDRALTKLTPQKRLIFILSRNQGKTYNEIGETLKLSPHTVKSHLVQATKFVREYLMQVTVFLISFIGSLVF